MPSTLGPAPAPEKPAPLTVAGRPDTLSRRLRQIRHVALDMDGTIYSGGTLFDCTRSFLAQLTGLGIGYTF